ncbi:hypothetical protein [Hymenobacter rubripertinctus]|uniref:hypothetical protein n=1 Tax=Hymenobacter rubripertinctus TaxID=2029981 RepID=UPI0011C41F28|nr:hypothetical protein [Hymenobacter rubripertinctus]
MPQASQDLALQQPEGLPGITYFVYEGLDAASFQAVVTAKVAVLNPKVVDSYWKDSQGSNASQQTTAVKQAAYVAAVMAGQRSVEVDGGEALGQVQVDANNTSAYPLIFKAYEGSVVNGVNEVLPVSPLYFIRYLPEIAQSDVWLYHPLLTASSTYQRGAKFYIGFQVSNITTADSLNPTTQQPDPHYASYFRVNGNSWVRLYDYNAPGPPVASAQTNFNGIAYFELTPAQVTGNADFYFVIEAPTTDLTATGKNPPIQMPTIWATALDKTRYWLAADGRTRGCLVGFKGFQLGNPITPLWFNVGVDYIFDFSFAMPNPNKNSIGTEEGRLPTDIPVALVTSTGVTPSGAGVRIPHVVVDASSAIYGLSFAIRPGDTIQFDVTMELNNPNINMKRTRVISVAQRPNDQIFNDNPNPSPPIFIAEHWLSANNSSPPVVPQVSHTSLRNVHVINTNPVDGRIRIDSEYANQALALLNYSRELAVVMHYLTDGDYPGTELDLKLFHILSSGLSPGGPLEPIANLPFLDQVPLSYPLHSIYLSAKENERNRNLIIHESSHQVMYQGAGFSSSTIIHRFANQVFGTGWYHNESLLSSSFLGLTEGWAEAMGGIFCGWPKDICLNQADITAISQPPIEELSRGDVHDGTHTKVTRYIDRLGFWGDELNWLYTTSKIEDPNLKWRELDPDRWLLPQTQQPSRINRGQYSEGAFAAMLVSLFWDFVVGGADLVTDPLQPRYIKPDPTGDPRRTNSWMTAANQPAISRRFKALFWEPIKSLATLSSGQQSTSAFLRDLATRVSQQTISDLPWSGIRARMLLWNMSFPTSPSDTLYYGLPTLSTAAADRRSGPLAGGNRATFKGSNLVDTYTAYSQRLRKPFRHVYMEIIVDGAPVTDLRVESASQLSCVIPAGRRTGQVDVRLQLWVRDVEVWLFVTDELYTYV